MEDLQERYLIELQSFQIEEDVGKRIVVRGGFYEFPSSTLIEPTSAGAFGSLDAMQPRPAKSKAKHQHPKKKSKDSQLVSETKLGPSISGTAYIPSMREVKYFTI